MCGRMDGEDALGRDSADELIEKADPDDRATNVIFKSTDGYTTILTLDYIRERNSILAGSLNGIKLPPAQCFPLIVVADDRLGYKWARWVE
nr:molybdopterin-dependent oxidoreductase [uncultured Mesotoga sp.]